MCIGAVGCVSQHRCRTRVQPSKTRRSARRTRFAGSEAGLPRDRRARQALVQLARRPTDYHYTTHHRRLRVAQPGPLLRRGSAEPEREARALRLFAASAVVPQANGISPHQEGNNIYGAYGRIDDFLVPHSNIEPFFLWRVQPAEVVEPATSKTTGKENERAFGVRIKAQNLKALDYSGEVILETGTVGPQPIRARSAGRRGIPVPRCGGQASGLCPVRLCHGQRQSEAERIAHHLRHYLPDSSRPLWNHRPVRLAEH